MHAKSQHPNAVLTPDGRRRMVTLVLEDGWGVVATAERFQVDAKTVRKWRDRFVTEGPDGLCDRSSRPRRCPNEAPPGTRDRVLDLRSRRRWGAAHIAHELGMAASTVQKVLVRAGVGRLDRGDRPRRTRPYRPQTNGKIERFHRILLEEWAYIRPWTSETERHRCYADFRHFYNHHRSHGSLGWATPAATLNRLSGDNLCGQHI